MKLPYSLHILVSLVTWGFIAVSLIILITQSSFGYLIYEDSMYIDGSVVSPFDSILEKYSPKSLKPCSYPGLIKPYNNTFLCDFPNSNSSFYCPNHYACSTYQRNKISYICIAENQICTPYCIDKILNMDYLNGNETAKVLQIETSAWYVYTISFSICFFFIVCCVMFGFSWIPKYRFEEEGVLMVICSGFSWCVFIFVSAGLAYIYYVTMPLNLADDLCFYEGDILNDIYQIGILSNWFFNIEVFQLIISFFTLWCLRAVQFLE